MRFKFICLLALLLHCTIVAFATIVQKMVLKNGSVLEGYISMQRPGKDFIFTTERAIICLSAQNVSSIIENSVNYNNLSKDWQQWGEENDAFIGMNNDKSLILSDIVTSYGTINKVRILERGTRIKYLEISNNTYALNWDTIAKIQAPKRKKTALSGLNRMYKLKDGREIEGEYVEEIPEKTLGLATKSGVIEVFETDKIVKYSIKKLNPDQDLVSQSELLDIIHLKNNNSPTKGVIIEQNYDNTTKDNSYLLLQTKDGTVQKIKLDTIEEYRKEVNPKFAPLFYILLNKGELRINRQQTNTLKITEEASFVLLPNNVCLAQIKKRTPTTKICIETRFSDKNKNYTIVKVRKIADKKKRRYIYGFTFEDIVKSNIQSTSIKTSVNEITKFEYEISDEGLYAIYNPKDKTVIPFNIK